MVTKTQNYQKLCFLTKLIDERMKACWPLGFALMSRGISKGEWNEIEHPLWQNTWKSQVISYGKERVKIWLRKYHSTLGKEDSRKKKKVKEVLIFEFNLMIV